MSENRTFRIGTSYKYLQTNVLGCRDLPLSMDTVVTRSQPKSGKWKVPTPILGLLSTVSRTGVAKSE